MPKIIILKGLPASSKSTWSKEQVAKDPNTKRVSKDDLRLMLDNSRHSKANEKFVLKVRDFTIMEAINDGHNIIVDDTNLHPKHEERIRELAKTAKLKTTVEINDSFLEVPLEECIKRDLKRPNSVGEKVIRDMHKQAFPDLYKELCCPIVQDKNLPKACIFDIDGSLSKMGDRSPYDWKKVGIDTLNEPVFQFTKCTKKMAIKL
jgi:predicted kinase